MDRELAIILFDGHCALCTRSVRFILERDRAARFRFASLSSDAAARECARVGVHIPIATAPDSVIVIADGRASEQSDALLVIVARLPPPWPIFVAFRLVPRVLRDWIYRLVARNRDRWFGRSDVCMLRTPEIQARLLE